MGIMEDGNSKRRLRDVMTPEDEVDQKYFLKQEAIDRLVDRSKRMGAKKPRRGMKSVLQSSAQGGRVYSPEGNSTTITYGSSYYGKHSGLYAIEPLLWRLSDKYTVYGALAIETELLNPETLVDSPSKPYRVYSDMGPSVTLMGNAGGIGAKTGLYAREVRPMLTPDRAKKRQNGRRLKDDGEDMFTLTTIDQHGVAVSEGMETHPIKVVFSGVHQTDKIYSMEGKGPTLLNTNWKNPPKVCAVVQSESTRNRVYSDEGASPTLTATDYKGPKQVSVEVALQNRSVQNMVYHETGAGPCITKHDAKGATKVATPLSDVLEDEVDEKYWVSQSHIDDIVEGTDNLSSGNSLDGPRAVSEVKYSRSGKGGPRVKEAERPMFTLRTETPHGVALESKSGERGVLELDGKRYNVRRLTPRECFRLQGFPDMLFDLLEGRFSDSQLYRQAGNAVTVNVSYEMGKWIMQREAADALDEGD